MKLPDDYDFETLIVPAVLLATPVAAALTVYGFSVSKALGFTLLGVELFAFFFVATSSAIRNAGKKIELKIFETGFPTTVMLRADKSGLNKQAEGRRAQVEQLSGVTLLTYAKAKNNFAEQDECILSAVNKLKEKMRSKKFNLLRRELKSYGYFRNMLAVKKLGLLLSSVGLVLSVCSFIVPIQGVFHTLVTQIVVIGVCIIFILFWLIGINKENVKSAANRYAEQFFKSLVLIKK